MKGTYFKQGGVMKIRYILGLSALSITMQSSFAVSAVEHGLIQPVGDIPIGELHAPNVQGQTPSPTPTTTVTVPKVQIMPVPIVTVPPPSKSVTPPPSVPVVDIKK